MESVQTRVNDSCRACISSIRKYNIIAPGVSGCGVVLLVEFSIHHLGVTGELVALLFFGDFGSLDVELNRWIHDKQSFGSRMQKVALLTTKVTSDIFFLFCFVFAFVVISYAVNNKPVAQL
eukprot:TRINITY_DN2126_c1_g1_i2.p1 TRINITY_DN2126_c1_g1~~TRINITY_DN2126_c1_g1_i2.p1  ORF type:complete len:121 (+),score=10.22 TRINITY_DN2126_c1_g1_i2:667-1029(+)